MNTPGWIYGLGAGVALALRRWPAVAFVVGLGLLWASSGQPADLLRRGLVVPGAVAALLLSYRWPAWPWRVAAVLGAVGLLAQVSWPLSRQLVWMGGLAVALLGSVETVRRTPREGTWGVLVVAGLVGVLLTALTGSVRLAEEGLRAVLPLLVLAGCPLDDRAGSAVAFVLAWTWMQAALWSYIEGWLLVPFLVLAVLWVPVARFGDRGRWVRLGMALGVAVMGCVPVVVDWVQDPPF